MRLDLRSSVRATPWAEPISVPADATVREVAALLHRHRIGAVVVRPHARRDAGVVSERDVVALVAGGGDPDRTTAGAIASVGMVTVDVGASLADVVDAMATHHVRHVGVTDGDDVVGVLSARDLLGVLARLGEEAADGPAGGGRGGEPRLPSPP